MQRLPVRSRHLLHNLTNQRELFTVRRETSFSQFSHQVIQQLSTVWNLELSLMESVPGHLNLSQKRMDWLLLNFVSFASFIVLLYHLLVLLTEELELLKAVEVSLSQFLISESVEIDL